MHSQQNLYHGGCAWKGVGWDGMEGGGGASLSEEVVGKLCYVLLFYDKVFAIYVRNHLGHIYSNVRAHAHTDRHIHT